MSSTGTSILMRTENDIIGKLLCNKYNVKKVEKNPWISKKRMAELFLLGAEFKSDIICGEFIIYENTMYIISGRYEFRED